MPRKTLFGLVVSLLISLCALGAAPVAGAATTTQLMLPASDALSVLGRSCNGIAQHVYASGFASNGYPTGATHLETTCIGRYGYRFTYTAWASDTWTWYGETRSYAKLAQEPAGLSTSFSAEDSHGDRVYNTASAAYLETTSPPIAPPEPPTNVTAYAYRTGEEGESGPQDFSIGWTLAPETAGLITSSTVTAKPVGSSAPTLTATVSGAATGVVLGTLEPVTTYLITVTSTDAEGTSRESTPFEAKSLTVVALAPPIAVTEPAAGVTATTATLEGHVNPAGEPVEVCEFEYGPTESYGTVVPCSSLPAGEGETPLPVSAPVGGLTPNTTYHARLIAQGPGGTSRGGDWPFTTLSTETAPAVTALSPKSGSPAGGTLVKITGTGLTGATDVMFGSAEAYIVAINSNTSMSVEAPPGSVGAVNVTVTTPGGTSAITSKDRFSYLPTVAGISPNSASTAGGTSVTVTGTGFGLGKAATVFKFGTVKATSVDCTSTTECTMVSPAHAAGIVDVKATVSKVTSATSRPADEFTYS
jgi:hypothetical protein